MRGHACLASARGDAPDVGRPIESSGYFCSACCWCGESSVRDVAERFVAGIIESES